MQLLMIHDPDSARFMFLGIQKGKVCPIDNRSLGFSSEYILDSIGTLHLDYDGMTPIEYFSTRKPLSKEDFSDEAIRTLFFGAKTVDDMASLGYFFEDKTSNLETFDELWETLTKDGECLYVRSTPPKDFLSPHGFSPFYVVKGDGFYVNDNYDFIEDNIYEAARFLTSDEAVEYAWNRDLPNGFEIEVLNYITYEISSFNDGNLEGYGSRESSRLY